MNSWKKGDTVQHYYDGVPASIVKSCVHDGTVTVYTTKAGVSLYGAMYRHLVWQGIDLLLDCTNTSGASQSVEFVKSGPKEFMALNKHVVLPPIVRFNWLDGDVPIVGVQFWKELLSLVPTPGIVVATCIGGHGRTGTCLSALMIADGIPPDVAIANVRTKHCNKAVENKWQEEYLESLGAGKTRQKTA